MSVNLSSAREYFLSVLRELLLVSGSLDGVALGSVIFSARRSQSELVQSFTDRSESHPERITCSVLGRDEIYSFFIEAKKRMN